MLITNAFSLNMMASLDAIVECCEVSAYYVADQLKADTIESAVGHADTAALFSGLLGITIPCERRTLQLKAGDVFFVGQYIGPRLPEGACTLPEGAVVKWVMATLKDWPR